MRYETLADARAKLQGTMAYYNNRAVYIREVGAKPKSDETFEFYCRVNYLTDPAAKGSTVSVEDKKLRYMEINVGYINSMGYATWFCRMPYKQYRQGLRNDQVEFRDDSGQFRIPGVNQGHFLQANVETGRMMENTYPSFEDAMKSLRELSAIKVAFHKDFAIYTDKLRGDFVMEHKGVPIAFSDLTMLFKCNPEYRFLRETMQDMKIRVA